jgi:3-oxoacyl-[acyl-carrier protein] reductase
MNRIDLAGKRAVVTGGAQGIGRAIAERLLASGARVSIWDADGARAETTAAQLGPPETVHALRVDVTSADDVEAATTATAATWGGIDILVANAGISGPNQTLWQYAIADWQRVLAVNLTGVFLCCRAVVPVMIRHGYGRIVTVASIAGKEGNPNACAYSASKAGVIALTKSLGKELAGHDIAVNCVTPAAAQTAILDQMTPAHVEYMLGRIPRGRFLQVEEAAAMVAWLVSSENSFTTGAVFDLSGGRATY